MEFQSWPKITRLENRRTPVFTEKIDGTNACIVISKEPPDENTAGSVNDLNVWVQSRSRFIKPGEDNFGFAGWVVAHLDELIKLGEGHHFGEWWGLGIQRGYDQTEKRFSLFNTHRWHRENPPPQCCSVVPRLPVSTAEEAVTFLKQHGSLAAPGYMNIEGAIMFDVDTKTNFKIIVNK